MDDELTIITREEVEQWLADNERTYKWLATKSGLNHSYLWRMLKGKKHFGVAAQRRVTQVIADNTCTRGQR